MRDGAQSLGGQARDAGGSRRSCDPWAHARNSRQADSWTIHDEQNLTSFGRGSLKKVSFDLPDGVSFDQYVIQLPEAVIVTAVNDDGAVPMARRHRFILDSWMWELPVGTSRMARSWTRRPVESLGKRPGGVLATSSSVLSGLLRLPRPSRVAVVRARAVAPVHHRPRSPPLRSPAKSPGSTATT